MIAVVGIVFGLSTYYKTNQGRLFVDGKLLNLWLVGTFIRQAIYSRFSRLLGLMLKSGVNILPALEMMGDVVGNAVMKEGILRVKQEVSEGSGVAQQLKRSGLFPNLLIQMVSAGESSGKIDELLELAADHYDNEVERMTKNIEAIIEPAFILILGLFVTVLVLGVFLPMWNLYGIIGAEA
jgi:type IV pilus assembly protein PilC